MMVKIWKKNEIVEALIHHMGMSILKNVALQLCTCTWIEIMTGVGITLYLLLCLHNYILAFLTVVVFAPLIGFHFAIDKFFSDGKSNDSWGPVPSSKHFIRIRPLAKSSKNKLVS